MSDDQEQNNAPPDFGMDDDDTKNDSAMFTSALQSSIVDVSLSGDDDEDENPFGAPPPARKKTPTNTTNIVESAVDNEKNLFEEEKPMVNLDEDDQDLFGVKDEGNNAPLVNVVPATVATPQPSTPVKTESPMYSTASNMNFATSVRSTPAFDSQSSSSTPVKTESPMYPTVSNTNFATPVRSTPAFDSQISSSTPVTKSVLSETVTTNQPASKRSNEHDIEISVSDPMKVGDGVSSYMTYRITTKTTLPIFKKSEFSVNRRFSDFLGLHTKLVSKHLHTGIIIPSPPEKDSFTMAKVKMSKEETVSNDFIDRRRAFLERYLNRLVQHIKLLEDSDVREFLEMPTDLPKSTSTQALSGAGVLRALSNISNQVTKLTTKTSEQDQWFEDKHTFIVDLHTRLKYLYNQMNTLFSNRREAGHALKQFSTALNHLATTEEHTLLSSALIELANLEEKVDQVHNDQLLKEYSVLTELIKEYVSLLDMVQLAFHERIKLHQQWLHAEDTLKKKRETKTKLEQTPKGADKLPQAEMEINDWEGRVIRGKEEFERISSTIKQEMDVFEQTRVDDFKKAMDIYLKNLLEQQEKVLQIWESYLPEANKINV